MKRQIIAVISVALAPPILLALALQSDAPMFFVFPFTVLGALLGVPALRLFARRRWLSAGHFLLGGAFLGGCCTLVFLPSDQIRFINWSVMFVPAGAICALAFWFIGIWRNPDFFPKNEERGPI